MAWYLKRAKAKGRSDYDAILHQIQSARVAMLSPFALHIAEEMWEKLGNSDMVSKSSWSEIDIGEIDAKAIQAEDLLKSIINDITNILKVTKITPKKIIIYTADAFKSKAYHAILEKVMNEQINMEVIMKELIANPEYKAEVHEKKVALRMKVFSYYSKLHSNSDVPCCNCCREDYSLEFLSLDHINGKKQMNSEPELVKLGHSSKLENLPLLKWIIKNDFPEGFQTLCHNCNQSKGHSKDNTYAHERN